MRSVISVSSALSLILALQAQGHAIITPALGGGTARSDVQRPTNAAPCGRNIDVASLLSTSQAVPVTNGEIDAVITNFNPGIDGSRQVTAQIDPTGTGNSFQPAVVSTNGDKFTLNVGSQPLVIQVPAAMQSTTGTMLVSLKTAGGFGNCITATNGAASNSTATGTGNTTTTGTGAATGTGNTTTTDTGAATGTGAGAGAAEAPAAEAPAAADPADPLAALKAKLQKIRAGQKNKIRNAAFQAIH